MSNVTRNEALSNRLGWTQISGNVGISPGESKYLQNYHPIPDFSTWDGFGKLWEWAQQQDWWFDFWDNFAFDKYQETDRRLTFSGWIIQPDRFADTIYGFLP